VDVAFGSVIEAAIADAAGATNVLSPPFAAVGRAVAMDHDQPIAMSRTNTLDSTLNARSLRVESPARWYQRDGRGGTRIAQSDILRGFVQEPGRVSLTSGTTHRMDWFRELYHLLSDLPTLIKWGGYVGLTTIVFTETGLLIGFFLPGDSLLVTAGLLASQGFLNVYVMGALLTVAAIAGDSVGYSIGRAAGPRLFKREDSFFFNKKHLYRAHDFYLRHGGKTIVIARFVPILRTFAPVVAGAADMPYRRFIFFNIAGGVLWIWSMLMIGYVLGRYIPGIEHNIDLVIIAVIALSLVPILIEYLKSRKKAVTSDS
jgi:membrane-associated protein